MTKITIGARGSKLSLAYVEKVRKLSKANKTNINNKQSYRKVIRTIKNLNPKKSARIAARFPINIPLG